MNLTKDLNSNELTETLTGYYGFIQIINKNDIDNALSIESRKRIFIIKKIFNFILKMLLLILMPIPMMVPFYFMDIKNPTSMFGYAILSSLLVGISVKFYSILNEKIGNVDAPILDHRSLYTDNDWPNIPRILTRVNDITMSIGKNNIDSWKIFSVPNSSYLYRKIGPGNILVLSTIHKCRYIVCAWDNIDESPIDLSNLKKLTIN